MSFEDLELINLYSRKQAIEGGVLIDVTEQAREMRPWQLQYSFAQPCWSWDCLEKTYISIFIKELSFLGTISCIHGAKVLVGQGKSIPLALPQYPNNLLRLICYVPFSLLSYMASPRSQGLSSWSKNKSDAHVYSASGDIAAPVWVIRAFGPNRLIGLHDHGLHQVFRKQVRPFIPCVLTLTSSGGK